MGEPQPAAPRDHETAPATPAARIVGRFGVKTLAAWTGRHPSRVHAWTWPSSKGGTGGAIPNKARTKIIAGAKTLGEELAFADFEPQAGEDYLPDDVQ